MNKYILIKVVSHIVYAIVWFLIVVLVLNLLGLGDLQTGSVINNVLTSIFGWVVIVLGWIRLAWSVKKFIKNRPESYRCALNPLC